MEPSMPWVTDSRDGAVLRLHVSPRASRNAIDGLHGGALRVRLRAPPVDNKANAALIDFLASALDTARSALAVVSGATSREKRVAVRGLPAAEVRRRLHPEG